MTGSAALGLLRVTLQAEGGAAIGPGVRTGRAEALYERVLVEYGDDSVAQLGGVHLA